MAGTIVNGPFPQVSFLGASVMSIKSSVGWNQQASSVTVELVEDKNAGNRFESPQVGTPAKLVYEGLIFEGLVQRWVQHESLSGYPTFEVTLTDPREVLAGAQVILGNFRGAVNDVPNLINAFGYWESVMGFGGALTNESGMVWNAPSSLILPSTGSSGSIIINNPAGPIGIMPAIESLTREASLYGGPLQFRGHSYSVDLSGLPLPPSYYRLGGIAISILDAVDQICQDGGSDYICYLENGVIKFKCVSRAYQPSLGSIANFIKGRPNVTVRSFGQELRNDVTGSILLGGDIINLYQEYNPSGDTTIWPFWGMDVTGNVIMGQGAPEVKHDVNLNASPILDIIGDLTYHVDIPELRCALMDFDSWAAYVLKTDKVKADNIGLVSAIDTDSDLGTLFPDVILQRDLITDNADEAATFGTMNEKDYWTKRAQRVYEFVRTYAEEYFGKKFLVKVPFLIYWKYEAETTHLVASDEPADAGYTSDASMPLGLQFLNEEPFLTTDGRFECFVKFDGSSLAAYDLEKIPPDVAVVQPDGLFVKGTIDQNIGIVYPPGSVFPYVVVDLPVAVYGRADCPLGSIEDIATILKVDATNLTNYAAGLRHGSFPMKICPAPYRPIGVALPMKSNRDSYGPWSKIGVPGKVNFQRDESLVPWNYGDYGTMNAAAQAKLANSATNMQAGETGSFEEAGAPSFSLGDVLVAGGPNITGINVSVSTSGVTTSYDLQTFTPRFGRFAKDNADRLRRLGLTAQDMRRAIRVLFQKRQQLQELLFSSEMGFMANASRAVRQMTPHEVLVGTMTLSSTYGYRTQVSTQIPAEAIANIRADSPDILAGTGCMSLEGLLRPFSTDVNNADDMPNYESIGASISSTSPCRTSLDPFGDKCDIELLLTGDSSNFQGIHIRKQKKDSNGNIDSTYPHLDKARPLGLRGPMVMVGWGFEYTGKPVPNSTNGTDPLVKNWGTSFLANFRKHPEDWRAGPVGLFWDNWRKIWTIPTFLFGTLATDLSTGGTATLTIDGTGGDQATVSDYFGATPTLTTGSKVCAAYDQLTNTWKVIAAVCSG